MTCNWKKEDYFSLLIAKDKKAHDALEMLVDDLHTEKDATILTFLSHSGAEDFLWGLSNLLGCDNPRVAGNSAYIIGTLAESDLGCHRILGLAKGSHSESKKILSDLTRMLTFEDAESVMNAAGTMGTLAESHEGREWMLSEDCLDDTITHVTALLHAENLWTASNAALVLARLSISENGCSRILHHQNAQHILTKLVQSLGVDEAGRGMNAAFAIGRLCDMEIGRKSLLQLSDSERMLSALAKMLSCNDTGASKNACFALSCLATNTEGHTRLLNNIHSDDILRTLSELLSAEDSETGWFAAMTLRTLASQPRGCLRLRDHPQVIPALKSIERKTDVNADLKEEATTTLDVLKKLEKPPSPFLELLEGNVVRISWDPITTKSGLVVRYQIYDCSKCVYTGKENFVEINGLQPCTQYTYKLRAYTEGDESPFSDSVTLTTEEAVPFAPENLRVLGCTITQLKIGWDPPLEMNGTFKGYYVYQGDKMVEHTYEMCSIITGLQASTSYDVSVCASTTKGKGEKAVITGTTADIGAHAPSKPMVQVLGRNEIHISWHPPEVPLGRITRYDVIMNNKVIYSGTDLAYTVRRLTPDTEYTIVVVALTNEGKFDSKPTKKKTSKDEFDSNRPPLYQPPRKESIDEEVKPPPPATQKKKRASLTGAESKSRSSSAKRSNTPKDHGKSPGDDVKSITRPTSASSSLSSSGVPTPVAVNHTSNTDVEKEHMVREISPSHKTSPDIKKESQQHQPPPVPKTRSPGLSVHFKEPHPSSYKKPQKPEAPAINHKMFPVSMSYVSIQGGDREEVMASSHPNDQDSLKRERSSMDSANSVLKMQRSRTMIHSGRTNLRTHPLNESFNNSHTRNVQDVSLTPSTVSLDTANKNKQSKTKPIINDLPIKSVKNPSPVTESDLTTVSDTNKSSEHVITSAHRSHKSSAHRSHHTNYESGDKNVKTTEKLNNHSERPKSIKETFLPKPSLPSQQYLESGGTNWGSRTLPSPRSSYEFDKSLEKADPEWLTKRFLELQYSTRGGTPHLSNHLSPSGHPGDCSYFLDLQQSVYHRTNTYVNSHRPSGKRTLERLKQQGSAGGSNPMPLINNFNPDFSENKSGMAQWNSKFIPMQLRTQPSNLAPSQLQRVNTTLGEPKGVQFKRVEAITRSQTLMDVRAPQGGMTLAEQAELYPVNMSAVSQRSSAKDRTAVSASRSARGSNLVRTSASRHREPDSMFLQKSWSVGASREGNLQSAR